MHSYFFGLCFFGLRVIGLAFTFGLFCVVLSVAILERFRLGNFFLRITTSGLFTLFIVKFSSGLTSFLGSRGFLCRILPFWALNINPNSYFIGEGVFIFRKLIILLVLHATIHVHISCIPHCWVSKSVETTKGLAWKTLWISAIREIICKNLSAFPKIMKAYSLKFLIICCVWLKKVSNSVLLRVFASSIILFIIKDICQSFSDLCIFWTLLLTVFFPQRIHLVTDNWTFTVLFRDIRVSEVTESWQIAWVHWALSFSILGP